MLVFLFQPLLITVFFLCVNASWSTSSSQQFSGLPFPKRLSRVCEQFRLCLPICITLRMPTSILSILLLQITWLSSNLEFINTSFKLCWPKKPLHLQICCYFLSTEIINHQFQHRYLQPALSDCKFIIYFCTLPSGSLPVSYIRKVPVHLESDVFLIVTAHWDIIIQHCEELLLPIPSQFTCAQLVVLCYWFITFAHPGTVHSALFSSSKAQK